MAQIADLKTWLEQEYAASLVEITIQHQQLTVEVKREHLISLCRFLRDDPRFHFEQLIDVCGIDYLCYGFADWATESTTFTGFSRGVEKQTERTTPWHKPRFAVAHHLLSLTHNHRIRLKVFLEENDLSIPSVNGIWNSANWFEREAFDLFGIFFEGHPDLRRILTDYGFIGYPFRKDFPLIGHVEVRYDAEQGRVVYEPVQIEPRVLVPKVIRKDSRYVGENTPDPHS